MDNPYQPQPGMEPPPNPDLARSQVNGPAIGLMAAAAIGLLFQVISLLFRMLGTGMSAMGNLGGMSDAGGMMQMMSGGMGIVFGLIGIAIGVVIIMGALKMRALENYNFAMAATVLAMVPCISPCCFIGLPVGIWALIILMKPEVKSAFRG